MRGSLECCLFSAGQVSPGELLDKSDQMLCLLHSTGVLRGQVRVPLSNLYCQRALGLTLPDWVLVSMTSEAYWEVQMVLRLTVACL